MGIERDAIPKPVNAPDRSPGRVPREFSGDIATEDDWNEAERICASASPGIRAVFRAIRSAGSSGFSPMNEVEQPEKGQRHGMFIVEYADVQRINALLKKTGTNLRIVAASPSGSEIWFEKILTLRKTAS